MFFDGRPPETLIEAPIEPYVFTDVEIDRRGWVLLSSEDGRGTLGTWIVLLTGDEVAERIPASLGAIIEAYLSAYVPMRPSPQ